MNAPGLSPPQVPQNLDQLRRLLIRAGQLEHVLLCAYLFTAYTVKQDPSEGGFSDDPHLQAEQIGATAKWKGQIIGVAVQEMLHLALASNLLTAVGGQPDFSRQELPPGKGGRLLGMDLDLEFPLSPAQMASAFGYPADSGAWLGLWPLADPDGKATALERFVWFESYEEDPELGFPGPPWGDDDPETASPYLAGVEELQLSTLVELYKAIAAGFVHLEETLGHDALFCGDLHRQVTEQEMTGLFNFPPATVSHGGKDVPVPVLVRILDVDTALMAINTIIVQGEGDTDDWKRFIHQLDPEAAAAFPQINTPPHHEVFQSVLADYRAQMARFSSFRPVRDVPANPLADDTCRGNPVCERHIHLLTGFDQQLAGLFDGLYNVLIDILALGFTFDSDSGDLDVQGYEKATLVQASVRAMVYLMAPLGNALTQLGAGPGFIYRQSHQTWESVVSALDQLAGRANELGTQAPDREVWLTPSYLDVPPAGHAYPRATLAELLRQMLAPDLRFMADRLRRVRGHKPPVDARGELYPQHVCQGLNACRGQDITGTAAGAGAGLCATADPHVCSSQNHCKGQGGCGFSPGGLSQADLQNHPGRNQEAGLVEPVPKVWPRQIYFFANPNADSACGSPILPSLKNTYGDNTDPAAKRGGDARVFATAHGRVWEFARLVFEARQREQSPDDPPAEFLGEDGQGIGRYR